MLRFLVLVLLLANGAYFAWSQGFLRTQGLGPLQEGEPQRLAQQIQPEAVRILTPEETRHGRAGAPANTPADAPTCLQTGVLDEAHAAQIRTVATDVLPQGSWSLDPAVVPARWILYMGKYPDEQAVEKKKAELRNRRVSFQALDNAALEPGLSLGSFASEAAANEALGELALRGIRTARVLQERAEMPGQRLRLPALDDAQRGKLEALRPALAGQLLQACG